MSCAAGGGRSYIVTAGYGRSRSSRACRLSGLEGGGIVAHQRIRKFNTNDYYPDQQLGIDLAMAVRAGNHVFLRGQTAMTFDGKIVGVGDPTAQAEHAMSCVKILLEEAGAK